ncbi:MAG TPA: hypothetical protein DCY51_08095 [Bacteroidetes bacterium]|nr:hypothetical protein [Bacteroidota bacterium]
MPSIKHRISNVLAWAGFLLVIYILAFAGLTAGKLDPPSCFEDEIRLKQAAHWLIGNEDKKDTQEYAVQARMFLSLSDKVGDGCNGSLWMSEFKIKRDSDGFSLAKLSQLNYLFITIAFGVLNYLIVGSFRVFPWKKIEEKVE